MERSPLSRTAHKLAIGTGPAPAPAGAKLPQVGVLHGLSEASLRNLSGYGECEVVAAGREIIREGAIQERLYVLVQGRLALTAQRGAKEMPVGEAHSGECLGEACLLEPSPAPATIRVIEDATLWSVDITGLRLYVADHPGGAGALLMGIACCLAERLREANGRIVRHHQAPVETLPKGRERAITASNTPIQPGFFERIRQTMAIPHKKVRISTKIKM